MARWSISSTWTCTARRLHLETAEPVVLIHGLGCDWRHWSPQIGWLAHSRRVTAPDVRGGAGKTRWCQFPKSSARMSVVVCTGHDTPTGFVNPMRDLGSAQVAP